MESLAKTLRKPIRLSDGTRRHLRNLLILYVLFFVLAPRPLWRPGVLLVPSENLNVAEAEAWLDGTMAVRDMQLDAAVYEGQLYNVFPPLVSILSIPVLLIQPAGFPYTLLSLLFVLPLPGLAYALFLRRCESSFAALLMAGLFVLGTSVLPVASKSVATGNVCRVNNTVTQIGLLILLLDFYGRRRWWVGGLGLMVCGWARWHMLIYAVPYIWGLIQKADRRSLRNGIILTVVLFACPLVLNMAKFGHPLDTGYAYIYNQRAGTLAQRAWEHGVFSPVYVPQNLYWMFLGLPNIFVRGGRWFWMHNSQCSGILWTTPLLIYAAFDFRRLVRLAENRALMAAIGVVFAVTMLYHNNGYGQRGFNRFSLDFVLPLLVMIAPQVLRGRRRYLTPLLVVWSVVYFGLILY